MRFLEESEKLNEFCISSMMSSNKRKRESEKETPDNSLPKRKKIESDNEYSIAIQSYKKSLLKLQETEAGYEEILKSNSIDLTLKDKMEARLRALCEEVLAGAFTLVKITFDSVIDKINPDATSEKILKAKLSLLLNLKNYLKVFSICGNMLNQKNSEVFKKSFLNLAYLLINFYISVPAPLSSFMDEQLSSLISDNLLYIFIKILNDLFLKKNELYKNRLDEWSKNDEKQKESLHPQLNEMENSIILLIKEIQFFINKAKTSDNEKFRKNIERIEASIQSKIRYFNLVSSLQGN